MANKKGGTKRQRAAKWTEYRFKIDAFTPATMPMARLGAYIIELATMLGEQSAVHFMELEEGSTIPVLRVDHEAIPKVESRVNAVRQGDGPPEAVRAFRQLNRYLREDNAVASLCVKRGKTPVLTFPGRDEKVDPPMSVRQRGTVDGKLVRIGGTDQTIHVTLQSEGQQITHIRMNEGIAKQLAPRLFEFVRLSGTGKWMRDSDGNWTLEDFKVESFESLRTTSLSGVLGEIRAIGTGWDDKSAYEELNALRNGPQSDINARH